ncbi:MAG TPA: NAD(P)-binding protein [Conexibacter sp.]|nr:NAD(P)-binding protein [Conexibacter sp.]
MSEITVVGGGIAGLVASIACAEGGAPVRLLEAHDQLGGRGRSTDGPYAANFGPHALYANGTLWRFLAERDLLPPVARPALLAPVVFRVDGKRRRTLPPAVLRALPKLRGEVPDDVSFREWATERASARAAELLSHAAGVFTFDHDPGRLSAAFVWERFRQAFLDLPPKARFPRGGWSSVIERLEAGARAAGVRIETGTPVTQLPSAPVIVATELADARRLLSDETVRWEGTRTVSLDLGLQARRGDAYVLWDLDESGWVERYSAMEKTLAPRGESLVQGQIGLRPGEPVEDGERRLSALLDLGFKDWRERTTFRRRMLLDCRAGAVDLPGTSWRDRPAIDRGDGVFLAGDMVAAPGLLSDPVVTSALEATRGALTWAEGRIVVPGKDAGSVAYQRVGE